MRVNLHSLLWKHRPLILFVIAAAATATGCSGRIGEADPEGEMVPLKGAGGGPPPAASPGSAPGVGGASMPSLAVVPSGPGPAPLRRLTKIEYDSTIADLLGDTRKSSASFPAETLTHGFDNNAAAQVVTATLAEEYLAAAEAIAVRAVAKLGTLLPCDPNQAGEDSCARSFITTFGRRAARRPLSPSEIDSLFATYTAGRSAGTFAGGIELVIARLIQSPSFLYRIEWGEPAEGGRVRPTSYEMASRLSYLLWGSMPDDNLLKAAESNQLRTGQQVANQARRMLSHPRARKMVTRFHDQWLAIQTIEDLQRHPKNFPDWAPSVKSALHLEISMLIDDVIWNGGGDIRKLFTAEHSFMNRELASFLGFPGAGGIMTSFQRVSLSPNGPPGPAQRMGLLTTAGLLAALASNDGTSPVLRGKFVLEQLLCIDIPPPPPNVQDGSKMLDPNATTRQRFEQHSKAACASCHRLMDPIGFALEGFDAVGKWRSQERGQSIDVRGVLTGAGDVDGDLAGPIDLARKVAGSSRLGACVARHWFRFAHGRLEEAEDTQTVTNLANELSSKGFDLREFLVSLTQTEAFMFLSKGRPQ